MPRKVKTTGLFRDIAQPPATAQERTDAAVRLIRESEAEKRAELTASLRAARLAQSESGADTAPASGKTLPRD